MDIFQKKKKIPTKQVFNHNMEVWDFDEEPKSFPSA